MTLVVRLGVKQLILLNLQSMWKSCLTTNQQMAMTDSLKSTGEGPGVARMLFLRLHNLTVASPTTKVAVLLSLRGSSSLCAAVTQCPCLPVLATSHIYINDTIWSQFQTVKSAQHRHECCGSGTAFSSFGDITPVGDLEVKISNQLQLSIVSFIWDRMSRRDGWPSHSKVQSYVLSQ